MPGFAEKTKLFVIQMEEQKLFNMVERLGNRPRFAVMHVGWYKGSTITSMPHKYECYVTKQNKVKHAAYTFSYVLATFWGNDDFQPKLFRKGLPLAIQILGPRKMRLGLTDEGKEFLMQNVPRLTGTCLWCSGTRLWGPPWTPQMRVGAHQALWVLCPRNGKAPRLCMLLMFHPGVCKKMWRPWCRVG